MRRLSLSMLRRALRCGVLHSVISVTIRDSTLCGAVSRPLPAQYNVTYTTIGYKIHSFSCTTYASVSPSFSSFSVLPGSLSVSCGASPPAGSHLAAPPPLVHQDDEEDAGTAA